MSTPNAGEDVRLRYRYLDLRRPEMQDKLRLRAQISSAVRRSLEAEGYCEVETPTLTRSTPEVPETIWSRAERIRGILRAAAVPAGLQATADDGGFREVLSDRALLCDEDLRHDRQPEFTQIDVEASFVREDDIMAMTERMLRSVFTEVLGIELPTFPVLSFDEAMRRYGSDKPDLRNPLELLDVADLVAEVEFKVFSGPATDADGRSWCFARQTLRTAFRAGKSTH